MYLTPHTQLSSFECLQTNTKSHDPCQVPLEFSSLTTDTPYLLDVGERIFVLECSGANKTAKFYTRDMAQLILATDRRAKGDVCVLAESMMGTEGCAPEWASICRLLAKEQPGPIPAPKVTPNP